MIDQDPFHANQNRSGSGCVTSEGEVPGSTGCSNDELEAANEESVNPQTSEEMIQEDVLSLLCPINGRNELKRSWSWPRSSYRADVDSKEHPE